jgi:hypothetical protein
MDENAGPQFNFNSYVFRDHERFRKGAKMKRKNAKC